MTAPEGEATRDTLLGGRVVLWQPRRGYRAAIDPVLLAAAVEAAPGSRALDLGCGAGAVALCLLARLPGLSVVGLEIDPGLVALAARNAAENGAADRFRPVEGAAGAPHPAVPDGGFDLAVCNPPWLEAGRAAPSPSPARRRAAVEGAAGVEDWIAAAARALRPGGTLATVHRADRLDALLAAVRGRFGGIVVHPLRPRAGADAKRVLLFARKGSAAPTRLAAGTVLHGAGGAFAPDVEAALRGAPLPLGPR